MSWINNQSNQNLGSQNTSSLKSNSTEFILVIIMLAVLTVLVTLILFVEIKQPGDTSGDDAKIYFQSILDYRKSLLGLILAAFGAWVGAGAAYFFGRENLRVSANSLLQLHQQMTGSARLNLIKVRDIPPKPLDSNFSEDATLKEIDEKFDAKPSMWFISTNALGKWYIISKELIGQYIQDASSELATKEPTKIYSEINTEIMKKTLKDVIPEIEKNTKYSHFINQYVDTKLEDNASNVNEDMDSKCVFLGIIKDDNGNLVQYFTTSDIRKALLKI